LTKLPVELVKQQYIARSVHFISNGKYILVAFLESHELALYQIDPWRMEWTRHTSTRIGALAVSPDEQHIVVSNLDNGSNMYTFPQIQLQQHLVQPVNTNVCLDVSFAFNGMFVLSGSDNGKIFIYDRQNGHHLTSLAHGKDTTLVQAVATHTSPTKRCIVASGTTSQQCKVEVKLWSFAELPPPVASSSGRQTVAIYVAYVAFTLVFSVVVTWLSNHFDRIQLAARALMSGN